MLQRALMTNALGFAEIANAVRQDVLQMSHVGKVSHLGSSLSCVDLIVAAYYSFLSIDPKQATDPARDRFILSKGHAVLALYAVLAHRGFFSREKLKTINQNASDLPEHPSPQSVSGIELATGSLGHGLSIGTGVALSSKILKRPYQVMALLSDGECNEGAVWEAALFAPMNGLNNLTAIIDYNGWQATARSDTVMGLSPLREKWQAFGWDSLEINGHDFPQILQAFERARASDRPTVIVAHTVKGKGVSFMEDDNNWHYRIPNESELIKALEELEAERNEKCIC